jgi:NitT/TauT family transport system permease protein
LAFVMAMNALANRLERKLLKWQPASQRVAAEPN